jgi:hypothetical protein
MTKSDANLNVNGRVPARADRHPTANPTHHPTANPTHHPTANPTHHPTANPTHHPTANPTHHSTANPTHHPTTFSTKFLRASGAGGKSGCFKELGRKNRNGAHDQKFGLVWFDRSLGNAARDRLSRGASIQTANFYLRAIKQFCRWLDRAILAPPALRFGRCRGENAENSAERERPMRGGDTSCNGHRRPHGHISVARQLHRWLTAVARD